MSERGGAIVVDGATGYLGNHVVSSLMARGKEVRALAHKGAREADIEFLRASGCAVYTGDLNSQSSEIDACFHEANTAVHLIGSIAPPRGQSLSDLHVEQTSAWIEHLKSAGVKNAVMVTALGSSEAAASNYHRTKWLAEEKLRQSGLRYIILRPSLLLGRQTGSRDSKLMRRLMQVIRTRKAVPLVRGGINRLQPLFIADMAEAVARCCEALEEGTSSGQELVNTTLELGGGEALTMREIACGLMEVMGTIRPIVALPEGVASLLALLFEATQEVPLLTRDQVKLSLQDNVCPNNDLIGKLGIHPTPVKAALETYRAERATTESRV
ncbi:MAG TPA: NAD(P)H-binding protein [Candidatus Obscuribacterales bacterium]